MPICYPRFLKVNCSVKLSSDFLAILVSFAGYCGSFCRKIIEIWPLRDILRSMHKYSLFKNRDVRKQVFNILSRKRKYLTVCDDSCEIVAIE